SFSDRAREIAMLAEATYHESELEWKTHASMTRPAWSGRDGTERAALGFRPRTLACSGEGRAGWSSGPRWLGATRSWHAAPGLPGSMLGPQAPPPRPGLWSPDAGHQPPNCRDQRYPHARRGGWGGSPRPVPSRLPGELVFLAPPAGGARRSRVPRGCA